MEHIYLSNDVQNAPATLFLLFCCLGCLFGAAEAVPISINLPPHLLSSSMKVGYTCKKWPTQESDISSSRRLLYP